MSIREVIELCKADRLNEALQIVSANFDTDPENIWNKRAAAWVFYYHLKKYAQPESFEAFKEKLIKIKQRPKHVFDTAWCFSKQNKKTPFRGYKIEI